MQHRKNVPSITGVKSSEIICRCIVGSKNKKQQHTESIFNRFLSSLVGSSSYVLCFVCCDYK